MTIRYKLAGLLVPAFLFACAGGKGAADEEINHEKTDSTEQAITAGWQIERSNVKSAHPLANDLEEVVEVDAPDTARKFRLRFARIDMERDYDFLVIQDEFGREIERVTGRHRNYVSNVIRGKKAKIILETDYSVQSWGFQLDQIRHRGCVRADPTPTPMRAARSCVDLTDAIRDLAEAEVRRRFSEGHFGGPIILRNATAEAAPNARADAPAHSETNVQVQGVDEADIVKTDGNFIYTIAGRQLRIFQSWPAADTNLVQAVDIEGWPRDLFLNKDTNQLIVFSGVQNDTWIPGPIGRPGLPIARMIPIWWQPDSFTKVTVFDIAGGTPRVTSETLVAGQYQSARRIDDSVRLVLRRQLRWPQLNYYPQNVEWNTPEYEEALEQLEEDAVRQVRGRALADWLPESYRVENGVRTPLRITCSHYQIQRTADEVGLTSVVTINTARNTPSVQDTSMLVSAGQIYQSTENLYVTSNHRWSCYEDAGTKGQYTYVHKLDVSEPSRTTYKGTGGFVGSILNQFSLDEHGDYLRVAITNNRWRAETVEERSVNRVLVLAQGADNQLDVVGQTEDLAPGERIFASRFVGEKGFVVTYRQIDPLFTLDLSDPTNPRVLGELKIPGFSQYIHVLDDDHLFSVGNDFDEEGRQRLGLALSIFDVSDMTNPRLKHKSVIGTTHGRSEALYNHRAFTMFRQPGQRDAVLAIPFTDWEKDQSDNRFWGTFKSSLKVFRVSPGGILEIGEVDHSDLFADAEEKRFGWWYRPNIRRGVFVEDYVYAISDIGLRVAEWRNPENIVAEIAAAPQVENPTPVNPTVTETVEDKPLARIPDANRAGVSTTLEFTKDVTINALTVELDIKHTYKGDLVVTLEHNGTTETLHNRTGGSANDIKRTFVTERFKGTNANGTWTLKVVDMARADLGVINSWKLTATGTSDGGNNGGGNTGSVAVDETYRSTDTVAIPDNSRRGASSTIEVPQGVSIETLEVTVDITHTYKGDLEVVLEHDGTQVTLHDRSGGSRDDVKQTFEVSDFNGTDGRGTWTLRVVDHARADVGTINGWNIRVTGQSR